MATSQNEFSFFEGNYRFTDPVRYFTSTDPYYWEVDNIPLKQLQENDLWLKDQIEQGFKNFSVSFDRKDFNELKPFSDGEDNVVKVKPGKFSARINYVDTNHRLMEVTRVLGQVFDDPNSWIFATLRNATVSDNVDKIVSTTGTDSLGLNGLVERTYSWHVKDLYSVFEDISIAQGFTGYSPLQAYQWGGVPYNPNDRPFPQDESALRPDYGFRRMPTIEGWFMKFWRGVFRIAVVNVPETLEIEVPPFSETDFDYIDENGNTVSQPDASVRIDLLFVYAKPIDVSGLKVKGSGRINSTRTLTTPQLGLVRGAGVILNKGSRNSGATTYQSNFDSAGNLKILASPADASSLTGGFTDLEIRGSFPAPDDLINAAPLILETLEGNDPRLVGQTGLPLAYIVVKKDATTNEFGEAIITDSDIIDIRPIFRTTELTYNERAGLAAAFPQTSIANPVVTDARLKNVTITIGKELETLDTTLRATIDEKILRRARVVGAGTIFGGSKFGPEGAIRNLYSSQGADSNQSYARLRSTYNFASQQATPFLPDWDVAPWVPSTGRKTYPNDCVHLHAHPFTNSLRSGEQFDYIGKCSLTYNGGRLEQTFNPSLIFYCKKTIRIDRSAVSWMDHYTVDAHLVNCVPLSHPPELVYRGNYSETKPFGGASDIWIEYGYDQFTIYCAWVGGLQNIFANDRSMNRQLENREEYIVGSTPNSTQPVGGGSTTTDWGAAFRDPNTGVGYARIPRSSTTEYVNILRSGLGTVRDDPYVAAGFTVMNRELSVKNNVNLQTAGICIYPTIKFTITGFPGNWSGYARNMNNDNAVVTLI